MKAIRSSRSSQCTAGSSQCAWRWLSRWTKSMATNKSSCASAASSLPPSGPDTTGFPQLITIARICRGPGVVISSGNSASDGPRPPCASRRRLCVGRRLRESRQPQRVDVARLEPAAAGAVHPAGDHVEDVTKPFADRARQMHRHPGAGDRHRAGRGGEIPRDLLDQPRGGHHSARRGRRGPRRRQAARSSGPRWRGRGSLQRVRGPPRGSLSPTPAGAPSPVPAGPPRARRRGRRFPYAAGRRRRSWRPSR